MKGMVGASLLIALGFAARACAGPEGEWFILGGKGGCWASDAAHPAAKAAVEHARKGAPLNCIAISPTDDWIDLVGGREFYFGGHVPAAAKLTDLWKDSNVKLFKCVAFTPQGGWAALTDTNDYFAEGIPDDAFKELKSIANAGVEIRSIAFTPQGGWVILEGDWGVHHGGLPDDAAKRINEIFAKKTQIICTAFDYRGNWVILTSGNGIWTNNVNLPVVRKLHQLRDENVLLRWVAFSPGDYPGECMIVRKPVSRVRAVLKTELTDSSSKVVEWFLYAPQAPSFPGQEKVKTTFDPPGKPVVDLSPGKQQLILSRVTGVPRQLRATLTVEATLYERDLAPRAAGVPAVADLTPQLTTRYTRSSQGCDFGARPVQDWLARHKLRRGEKESDLSFARRAYTVIRQEFKYEFSSDMDKSATGVIKAGKSDCGGLSNLMVAVLRANRIPARILYGRWAESQGPPDKTTGEPDGRCHAKAEFFAKGVGWVPLDMSAAVTDRDAGDYMHFGNDPGDFLTLAADSDFEVDSFVSGRVVGGGLQGLWWWRRGPSGGTVRVKETWQVTKEPAKSP